MEKYLEAGKVIGTHGIKGDVKIESWCDSTEVLCSIKSLYLDKGKICLSVKSSREQKNNAVVSIEGINSIEEAIALRGKIIYLNRNDINLGKDSFFISDIIGCQVLDYNTGDIYGEVREVLKTGANDVYQIKNSKDKSYLIPVIPDVVKDIDIEKRHIRIVPLRGLFDL